MRQVDLVIVGGGPAGMSAAVAAYESGTRIWAAFCSSASTTASVCTGSARS